MKKSTKYKLLEVITQLLPIIGAMIYCAPSIFRVTEKWLTLALLVVLIILFIIFKDAVKRYFQTPSAFKFSLIIAVITGFALLIGEELFIISVAALVGGLLAMPFNILYTNEIRPPTNKEMIDQLNSLKEDLNEDKSDKHD